MKGKGKQAAPKKAQPRATVPHLGSAQERGEVWVLAEQRGGIVQRISFELLARGRALADRLAVELTAVLLGPTAQPGLRELIERGADRVIHVDAAALEHFLGEPHMRVLECLIKARRPQIVLAGATTTGRTLMPLVAVRCRTGLTADCTHLEIEAGTGHLLQVRPAIGGNIMATIKSPRHRPQMATVRPRSMAPLKADSKRRGEIIIEQAPAELLASRIRRLSFEAAEADGANLPEAPVIIAGGRGLKKRESFGLIHELASLLGAAVGASRDAVDRGWIGYPHQVGLSGKTVSPRLYLCAGISGSVQHLAGIKTAENIIAINNNPDAPIFNIADYGVVADLFEVLPLLMKKLAAYKAAKGEPTESAPARGAPAGGVS